MFANATRIAVLVALAIALEAGTANAQNPGGVRGQVVDSFGAAINGAAISATSVSGYRAEILSGQHGYNHGRLEPEPRSAADVDASGAARTGAGVRRRCGHPRCRSGPCLRLRPAGRPILPSSG